MKRILYKILIVVSTLLLTITLTGCSNKVVPNENSITLTLDNDYASVIEGEIPSFTFNFEGNLNTIENVTDLNVAVFSNNEDIVLSDALTKLFEQYKDRMDVVLLSEQVVQYVLFSTLDENGKVKNIKYTPDDKKAYTETAFISLENGLKLTVDYSRFLYNGKTYYTWSMMNSITMFLYYPVMAIENGLKNKLVLITLPNRVSFAVGPSLKLSNVLNGASYIQDEDCFYYDFKYVDVDTEDGEECTLEQKQKYIIDYYVNEHNGNYYIDENGTPKVLFEYLENQFIVSLYDNNFKMEYVKKDIAN